MQRPPPPRRAKEKEKVGEGAHRPSRTRGGPDCRSRVAEGVAGQNTKVVCDALRPVLKNVKSFLEICSDNFFFWRLYEME